MMAGFTAAAPAVAAGVCASDPSAALVPPSTKVASTRSNRAVALAALTRIWTCSDPATPTGSVATLARAASALPGSGAESLRPTAVQEPHWPPVLLRTDTVTPWAVARSGNPTPTTSTPSVSRVSTLSDAVSGVAFAPAAAAVARAAVGCAAGMGTRSTDGRTACGAAPTETTGTTTNMPASSAVDRAQVVTRFMEDPNDRRSRRQGPAPGRTRQGSTVNMSQGPHPHRASQKIAGSRAGSTRTAGSGQSTRWPCTSD